VNARRCLLAAALSLVACAPAPRAPRVAEPSMVHLPAGQLRRGSMEPERPADMLATYQTAVQYHFWHALGLLGLGALMARFEDAPALAAVAWLLIAGLALFSGSLYLLALTGAEWLGAVTPLGGAALIAGWLWLVWWAWRL